MSSSRGQSTTPTQNINRPSTSLAVETSPHRSSGDCIVVQEIWPDPTIFKDLEPLEELLLEDMEDEKKKKNKKVTIAASSKRKRPTPKKRKVSFALPPMTDSDSDSSLNDLFTMHIVRRKKPRVKKNLNVLKSNTDEGQNQSQQSPPITSTGDSDNTLGLELNGTANNAEAIMEERNFDIDSILMPPPPPLLTILPLPMNQNEIQVMQTPTNFYDDDDEYDEGDYADQITIEDLDEEIRRIQSTIAHAHIAIMDYIIRNYGRRDA